MLTAFTKLFNIVFNSGHVPDDWSHGIISLYTRTKLIEQVQIIIGVLPY